MRVNVVVVVNCAFSWWVGAEVWGAESAGHNACGSADDHGARAVQDWCTGGAGLVHGRYRLSAPSAPPRALHPVQGDSPGAGGAGTLQG